MKPKIFHTAMSRKVLPPLSRSNLENALLARDTSRFIAQICQVSSLTGSSLCLYTNEVFTLFGRF
jgi:hypothetical protein